MIAAACLLWLSRGKTLSGDILFALVPIFLTGVTTLLFQTVLPLSPDKIHAIIGLSPVILLGLVLMLELQRNCLSQQAYAQDLARERQAIRCELHVGLLNDLARINATVQGLRRAATVHMPMEVMRVETLDGLSRAVAKRVRNLLKNALNETTTWKEFVTSMAHYAEQLLNAANIKMRFELDANLEVLPPMEFSRSVNLQHVSREAITNILKHAGATEVCVRLKWDKHTVWVDIEDNGHGYRRANRLSGGYGLDNMRYRMSELGGDIEIHGVANCGTRVRLRIPSDECAIKSDTR